MVECFVGFERNLYVITAVMALPRVWTAFWVASSTTCLYLSWWKRQWIFFPKTRVEVPPPVWFSHGHAIKLKLHVFVSFPARVLVESIVRSSPWSTSTLADLRFETDLFRWLLKHAVRTNSSIALRKEMVKTKGRRTLNKCIVRQNLRYNFWLRLRKNHSNKLISENCPPPRSHHIFVVIKISDKLTKRNTILLLLCKQSLLRSSEEDRWRHCSQGILVFVTLFSEFQNTL